VYFELKGGLIIIFLFCMDSIALDIQVTTLIHDR